MTVLVLPRVANDHWRWLLLIALVGLAVLVHPIVAFAILVVVALQRAYPLDFMTAFLAVVTGASFINYTRGQLSRELSFLTLGILFMLLCYTLRRGERLLAVARTPLTTPLLLFTLLTVINFVRGLMLENSAHFAGLELLAVFALASSFLVGNRATAGHLKLAMIWLWITGLGHAAMGFYGFAILHVRTGSIYFTPIPGVILALMLNFALRARSRSLATLWVLAMTPLLAHQFLSFTRGFWLAFFASSIFSAIVFLWEREERARRVERVAFLFVLVAIGLVVAGAALAFAYGLNGLAETALDRLNSSTGTQYSWETSSNVVRLVEYAKVLTEIVKAPLFGHALGYSFVLREPLLLKLQEQWYTHQNYLLITLKQGLLGLSLFLWMLLAGVRMGLSGLRLRNPAGVAWCAGTAAGTVHLMVYSNVHFPLSEANSTFTLALLWGITMALVRKGTTEVRLGAVPS